MEWKAMVCKDCRNGEHEKCPDNSDDGISSTWCDCQHLPPRGEQ